MTSPATFVAYIDESGDEGFDFRGGAPHWFVLGAVVLRRRDELSQVKLIDHVRDDINEHRQPEHRIPDKKPLHFRDLKHEQRKLYAARIAEADLRAMSVLIHKCDLTSHETFRAESRLYFYAARLLIERISWYCRDHKRKADPGDGSVDLVFSNRGHMDYKALRNYMDYLEQNRAALDYRAAPGVVNAWQVSVYSPGRHMGLQLADAVASSYYHAVEENHYGFTEDSYARLLLPCAYRYRKALWGYGIKIMPRESEEKRRNGLILSGWEP